MHLQQHLAALEFLAAEVMGDHRPARAIVPVGPLKGDYVIEVQATAALP